MYKSITLAFDVYGTLIDTNGVVTLLEKIVGEKAKAFSETVQSFVPITDG